MSKMDPEFGKLADMLHGCGVGFGLAPESKEGYWVNRWRDALADLWAWHCDHPIVSDETPVEGRTVLFRFMDGQWIHLGDVDVDRITLRPELTK